MPAQQEEFKQGVNKILEVVMFENWLRFYFIVENEDVSKTQDVSSSADDFLRIEIPEKSMGKIKELYPDLWPIANKMNNRNVDFESSRSAVLSHVLDNMDGKQLARGMAQTVFSSSTFQTDMQLFHAWVQIHEDQLDHGFLDFGTWRRLFLEWKNSATAKKIIANAVDAQTKQAKE